MGEHTAISWCDSTFNPVRGCTKVSPGCTNCYADRDSARNPAVLGVWGPKGTRVLASDEMWRKPLKWNEVAGRTGRRHLVFCASLADVFEQWDGPIVDSKGKVVTTDNERASWHSAEKSEHFRPMTMDDVRLDLFDLIRHTPHLTWLVLTKRIEEVIGTLKRLIPIAPVPLQGWLAAWVSGYRPENVWLGTSVEDQEWADKRVPELLRIPAKLHWLSVEPQLGPVDLAKWMPSEDRCKYFDGVESLPSMGKDYPRIPQVGWVIVGGESGGKARPFDLAWARSIVKQCRDAGVVPFVKQLGANCHGYWLNPDGPGDGICYHSSDRGWRLKHPAGADPSEWPHDLRIQETPTDRKVEA